MKYIQKVREVEAMQFTREKVNEIYEWSDGKLANVITPRCIDGIMTGVLVDDNDTVIVHIRENDYIIKENQTFVVYTQEGFEKLYEPVK